MTALLCHVALFHLPSIGVPYLLHQETSTMLSSILELNEWTLFPKPRALYWSLTHMRLYIYLCEAVLISWENQQVQLPFVIFWFLGTGLPVLQKDQWKDHRRRSLASLSLPCLCSSRGQAWWAVPTTWPFPHSFFTVIHTCWTSKECLWTMELTLWGQEFWVVTVIYSTNLDLPTWVKGEH